MVFSGHSVAKAYLSPSVLQRPNLTVAIHTTAEKILFEDSPNGPRAIGVQLSKSASAKKYRVKVKKEVIVCNGAVGTPHLLQVSGLGAKEDLERAGVPVVKNLSQVGKKFQDVSLPGRRRGCFAGTNPSLSHLARYKRTSDYQGEKRLDSRLP